MTKVFHFALGPVQGFVAQARRTRDLWAGSFLLSWLSGQAMAAAHRAGGTIVRPNVDDDPLFRAILEGGGAADPDIGTLVNRFKAVVPDDFPLETCDRAVNDAWRRLADRVWNRFVRPVAAMGAGGAEGVRSRWNRQIDGFWEMSWAMADGADTNAWLDRRKNWRSHFLAPEGGDHCMLMGDYQELSGWMPRTPMSDNSKWSSGRHCAGSPARTVASNYGLQLKL